MTTTATPPALPAHAYAPKALRRLEVRLRRRARANGAVRGTVTEGVLLIEGAPIGRPELGGRMAHTCFRVYYREPNGSEQFVSEVL